jgi:predicted transposase/invertase (TIGR01784 family)
MVFREKRELLALYNAVNGTAYDNPDDLEIVTLENAVYMNMKNDLAFLIEASLHLYEHQSTVTPNLPLRDLFYVAREYERLTAEKSLYTSAIVKIPTPRFLMFYNGTDEQPDCQVLKLSDAYAQKVEEPELELKVMMLNINIGHNAALLEKCKTLKDYSIYVERVRQYAKEMPKEEAVDKAVDTCIKDGILADFLTKYKAEARSMSIFEYDEEREMELIRQAEFEKGEAYGKAEGERRGKAEIILNMHRKNYSPKEISEIIDMSEEEVKAIIYNQEPVLV